MWRGTLALLGTLLLVIEGQSTQPRSLLLSHYARGVEKQDGV